MKNTLLSICILFCANLFAQNNLPPTSIAEINFLREPDGPSIGFQTSYQRAITKVDKIYCLYAGAFESFLVTNEYVAEEGTTGFAHSNKLGLLVTGELRALKNRNLFYNVSIFSGWGYRRTAVNLKYPAYDVSLKYDEDYHFLLFGGDSRIGYRWKNKWGAQLFGRYDFSRLIDKYRSISGEKPGFIFGIGLSYNWAKK